MEELNVKLFEVFLMPMFILQMAPNSPQNFWKICS